MAETVFQEVSVDMNLISDSIYLICMTFRNELDLKAAVFCQNSKMKTFPNVIPFETVSLNQTSFTY